MPDVGMPPSGFVGRVWARELAAVARAGGASVLWGTCAERETSPFGPWVEAASEHVATASPAELRAHLGTSLPVLAELAPTLAERLPDLAAPIELAPSASQVRAYEALSRLLLDAAAGSSLQCRVTASNAAGAATAVSRPWRIR